jgi:hypothetical protein
MNGDRSAARCASIVAVRSVSENGESVARGRSADIGTSVDRLA